MMLLFAAGNGDVVFGSAIGTVGFIIYFLYTSDGFCLT